MEKLLQLLDDHQLDALIVTSNDPHLSEYPADHFKRRAFISGFTGSAGTVVISRSFKALFTDSRYDLMAKKQLDDSWEILINKIQDLPEYLIEKSQNRDFVVGIDPESISIKEFNEISKKLKNSKIFVKFSTKNLIDLVWENRKIDYKEIYAVDDAASRTVSEKIELVTSFLAKEKPGSFTVISDLATIAWLLNLRGSDVLYSPVFYAFLFISEKEKILFTNFEKIQNSAKKFLEKNFVEIKKYDSIKTFVASRSETFLYDESKTTPAFLEAAKDALPVKFTINLEQSQKDELERHLIREGHKLDAVAVWNVIEALKRGEVEDEWKLSELFEKQRIEQGAVMPSFESITSVNANAAIVHYAPSRETAEKIIPPCAVLMDTGGQYKGCTTDITRCVYLGEAPYDYKFAYTLVLRSHISLAKQIFPKEYPCCALDGIAKAPMWSAKMDYGHGTGHGVGSFLNVHEVPPSISSRFVTPANSLPLLLNQLVTIEPGFYPAGKFGIRLENCYLVCDAGDGFYYLDPVTLVPFEDHLVLKELMTDEELKWYNDYQRKSYAVVCK